MERTGYIRIKFCGLTRLEDAVAAVQAGADMLGFNFYPQSRRFLAPVDCTRLVEGLREKLGHRLTHIQLVGIFVNARFREIITIMEQCGLDLAQLSGDETAEELDRIGERAFKAIRSSGQLPLTQVSEIYPPRKSPPALLVDAASPGHYGGSGLTADWSQAEKLARKTPILLAGGLNAVNVSEAIRLVRPWGVDVATGIETVPGIKDRTKMVNFVQAVRNELSRCE